MGSEIVRAGKSHRPSWNYASATTERGLAHDSLEMMESVRNVLEDIRGELKSLNSLLHCANFQQIPHRLKRISHNTYVAKNKKEPKERDL
jgi:hypothetical protein